MTENKTSIPDVKALLDGTGVKINANDDFFTETNAVVEEDDLDLLYSLHKLKPFEFFPNKSFDEYKKDMFPLYGKGILYKQILQHGLGCQVQEDSIVFVQYEMFFEGVIEPFDSTLKRKRLQKWRMASDCLIPGIEEALLSMVKGEISLFYIPWNYAFGEYGCPPRIPPKADILVHMEVVRFLELDVPEISGEMPENENTNSLSQCEALLVEGKLLFQSSSFEKSIKKMKQSLRLLDTISLSSDEEEAKMRTLRIRLNANLGGIYMHINRAENACVHCTEVLRLDPNHAKALLHFGRAKIRLNHFEKAEQLLKKGKNLYPHDKSYEKELSRMEMKKKTIAALKSSLQ